MTEFPKMMIHPHHRRGMSLQVGGDDYQGLADVLPPVVVQNQDQEEQYRAKGYTSGVYTPPAPGASPAPNYTPPVQQDWPRWVNGRVCHTEAEENDALANPVKVEVGPDDKVKIIPLNAKLALVEAPIGQANASPADMETILARLNALEEENKSLKGKEAARDRMAKARAARQPKVA